MTIGEWKRAWGPALRAQLIAERRLLPEHEAPWIDEWRQRLDGVLDHALEAYAAACLGIGGAELAGAERSARRLTERSPLRESGYRLLMDTLAVQGNVGEAMRVYDRARATLREELGTDAGPGHPGGSLPPPGQGHEHHPERERQDSNPRPPA